MAIGWKRRGEWAEFMPERRILASEDALRTWLLETLRMPPNMLRQMLAEDRIRTAGDRLRMHLFPEEAMTTEPADEPAEILYEDDAVLVAYKPAGMAVHATTAEQEQRRASLAHAIACHYAWTGQSLRVRHIHRLDTDTTGPVLIAKHALPHAVLDADMRSKAIRRSYAAIVHGCPRTRAGTIDAPIGKDRHHPSRRRVSPTGSPAVTHYAVEQAGRELSLVKLQLETGRTHQIRVHMSHIGHPLAGDMLYGGDGRLFGRQALHGEALTFRHPLSGEWLEIQAPWPEDMARLRQKI